jgi:hypothetical protein
MSDRRDVSLDAVRLEKDLKGSPGGRDNFHPVVSGFLAGSL